MLMIRVTSPECVLCHTPSVFTLGLSDIDKYRNGALIQDAFPYLSKDERETMISGTHAECWNKLFPEEDN